MKEKLNNSLSYVLLIFQPALFLAVLGSNYEKITVLDILGLIFTGILLGFLLFIACKKMNLKFQLSPYVIALFSLPVIPLLCYFRDGGISSITMAVSIAVYGIAATIVFFIEKRNSSKDTVIAVLIAAVSLIYILVTCALSAEKFSPDSYSYYEISKNIFSDFGKINTQRQYIELTNYGISFPYLYPAMIALVDSFCGLGIYSGEIINIGATILILMTASYLSKKLSDSYLPGSLAFAMLVFNSNYQRELIAARAVPLSILCVLTLICLLVDFEEADGLRLFTVGLVAGAGAVIRFDFALITVMVCFIIFIFRKKRRFKGTAVYACGVLAPVLPWLIYSITKFGTLWISDNSGTFFLTSTSIPTRFYMPGEFVSTLFTNPGDWFSALVNKCGYVFNSLSECYISSCGWLVIVMILLSVMYALLFGSRERTERFNRTRQIFLLALIVYALKTILFMMSGYSDRRYHVEGIIVLSLLVFCLLHMLVRDHTLKNIMPCVLIVALLFTNIVPTFANTGNSAFWNDGLTLNLDYGYGDLSNVRANGGWGVINDMLSRTPVLSPETINKPESVKNIEIALNEDSESGEEIRILFIGGSPYSFGAYTGIRTFDCIQNLSEDRLIYIMETFIQPTHIYISAENSEWFDILNGVYGLEQIDDYYPVYRINYVWR